MIKVLEGQITFGGMHDALEAVARHKNIKHGVLRVTSNSCSGLLGVFCGRFITGAMLSLTGEAGLPALRELLSAKDGSFALLDVSDEPITELNQSLGVDLAAVLASVDFSLDSIPVSEESLIGLTSTGEEVRLIDTSAVEDIVPPEDLTPERVNSTFQRITSLSEHLKAEELSPPAPSLSDDQFYDQPPEWERRQERLPSPIEISTEGGKSEQQTFASPPVDEPSPMPVPNRPREERHADGGNYAVVFDAAPPEPKFKTNDEFKRLKDWRAKGQMIMMTLWALVFIGLAAAIVAYGPQLAQIVSGVVPKQK